MFGGTIGEMMEAEMEHHLGYEKCKRSDSDDCLNGHKETLSNDGTDFQDRLGKYNLYMAEYGTK